MCSIVCSFGLEARDIDCAFKLFKREVVQFLPLQATGAMVSAETLIRLRRAGVQIKEVPVTHLPRAAGSPTGAKLSVIARAFREMLMLYGGELGLEVNKEVLKFITVGVINTMLDAVAYVFFTRVLIIFEAQPVAAKFFSFLVGTISSLFLNRYWTFGVRTPMRFIEVVRFYATVSVSLGANVGTMYVLVNSIPYLRPLRARAHDHLHFCIQLYALKILGFSKARAGATPQSTVEKACPDNPRLCQQ